VSPRPGSLAIAAFAAAALAFVLQTASARAAEVRTLAGSGKPGFADGPPSSASFLMPVALSYTPKGDLVVVDSAAQRIRLVSPTGLVTTIAGSGDLARDRNFVPGGYQDGDPRSARFNWPRGIALRRDGTVLVADTGNHCIREIENGRVSLFAGNPRHPGTASGDRLSAQFENPIGLATDARSNVYVADPGSGLRRIDPTGLVTDLHLGHGPFGVTVSDSPAGTTLYVVDADGILALYPDGTKWRFRSDNHHHADHGIFSPDPPGTVERETAMQAPVGDPFFVSALADGSLFFADALTNQIRYLYPTYELSTILAGTSDGSDSTEGGGYRDGSAQVARFRAPAATALRGADLIAVADTGNRRIRAVRIDPGRDLAQVQNLVPETHAANEYRVVFLGNSFCWYDSTGNDSVTSRITDDLAASHVLDSYKLVPSVRFVAAMGTLAPLDSIAHTLADLGVDDVVVLGLNYLSIDTGDFVGDALAWRPKLVSRLQSAKAIFDKSGIHFVVAIYPLGNEVSANETESSRGPIDTMVPATPIGKLLQDAVSEAGVDMIDTYPDFKADALHPSEPIAGTINPHFSKRGREILAESIVRGLNRMAYWRTKK
jgi:hypothetical protein